MSMRSFIATAATGLIVSIAPAASAQVFFGADTEGGSEHTRVTSLVNSTAASNAFLSNLTGVGTETFESFATGSNSPLVLTFPGAGTATLNGGGTVSSVPGTGTNGRGRYPISGDNYWEQPILTTDNFYISFASPVAAFGFWGIDLGDFDGVITLRVYQNYASNIYTDYVPDLPDAHGNVIFWGLIDTNTFDRIDFLSSGGVSNETFAFDDMTVGSLEQISTVPEPATMTLLATGLAGMAAARRRKQK